LDTLLLPIPPLLNQSPWLIRRSERSWNYRGKKKKKEKKVSMLRNKQIAFPPLFFLFSFLSLSLWLFSKKMTETIEKKPNYKIFHLVLHDFMSQLIIDDELNIVNLKDGDIESALVSSSNRVRGEVFAGTKLMEDAYGNFFACVIGNYCSIRFPVFEVKPEENFVPYDHCSGDDTTVTAWINASTGKILNIEVTKADLAAAYRIQNYQHKTCFIHEFATKSGSSEFGHDWNVTLQTGEMTMQFKFSPVQK
jgi:hypothetical protein